MSVSKDSLQLSGLALSIALKGILDGVAHLVHIGAGGVPMDFIRNLKSMLFRQNSITGVTIRLFKYIGNFAEK